MNITDYQDWCPATFIYGDNTAIDVNHATHGLAAEAGEIMGAYQKYFRGDYDEEELLKRVGKEIGGLMYYTAMLCNLEGLRLDHICINNMHQLMKRKEEDKIHGDGDDR